MMIAKQTVLEWLDAWKQDMTADAAASLYAMLADDEPEYDDSTFHQHSGKFADND